MAQDETGVVVVGAGQAAATLCEQLRKQGYDGPITVVGDEPHPPYQRPPLSKAYLLGEMARERLYLKPESFYADHGVLLRLGVAATAIDRPGKAVVLADGERLPYDRLALATGAAPRRLDCPGASHDGVHLVRSLADVDALAPAIESARLAVVVGGGYIGLEAAAVLRKKGLEVTVLHRSPRLLSRVASVETAEWFRKLHEEAGVHVRLNQTISAIEGAGRVERVTVERTEVDHVARRREIELEADLVVVGVGVRPNQRLAAEAGLVCENGIRVDETCRTSDPEIFAVGDVATLPTRKYGRIRLESVQNAIDQAGVAAANIAGGEVVYEPVPWFWSDQYDVKFQSAGLPNGYDRAVPREAATSREAAAGGRSHWLYREGRLICVEAMNDPRSYMVGKRLLEAGRSPDPAAVVEASDAKALLK